MKHSAFQFTPLAAAVMLLAASAAHAQQTPADQTLAEVNVISTAEEELKQAPGVSIISAEDLEKRPPANDLSELIRTMPGVNLTGNSSSGAYGNSRQIDLRGMGPENTLILIDGVPVTSRNSTRMGHTGERNSRGDSNWVPAELIDRIEVLRGPAAARYGSGAAGGVVNLITKAPTKQLSGSITAYTLVPEHSEEGGSKRIGFNLSGPLSEQFSYRIYGNVNKTDADDPSINATASNTAAGNVAPAGREGVRNKDVGGMLRWDLAKGQVLELETAFSRQGNIYTGDRGTGSTAVSTGVVGTLAAEGAETNILIRRSASLTHRGTWSFGTSKLALQYENTDNTRLNEGLAGGPEGNISSPTAWSTSELENYGLTGEVNMPMKWGGIPQMLTAGFELRKEKLNDPYAMTQTATAIPGMATSNRDGKSSADTRAVFVEDNINAATGLVLTPGVRFDDHSQFGTNWSPSFNASYELSRTVTLKGGIARAFKAPNLYQSNPNYLYYTRGNGCPVSAPSLGGGCYLRGNAALAPETSVNKEIGVAYNNNGLQAGLTYFHNDYRNKITGGMDSQLSTTTALARVYQWENAPKAIVQGFEGNLSIPLAPGLKLSNNLTYMIENKNKTTGEPLSVIPKYTVNSQLDWQINDKLSMLFTGTFYGKQEPRRLTGNGAAATGNALQALDPYSVWGVSGGYALTPKLRVRTGINNLFDKRMFRESVGSDAGAATYNEPGRSLFVNLTASF